MAESKGSAVTAMQDVSQFVKLLQSAGYAKPHESTISTENNIDEFVAPLVRDALGGFGSFDFDVASKMQLSRKDFIAAFKRSKLWGKEATDKGFSDMFIGMIFDIAGDQSVYIKQRTMGCVRFLATWLWMGFPDLPESSMNPPLRGIVSCIHVQSQPQFSSMDWDSKDCVECPFKTAMLTEGTFRGVMSREEAEVWLKSQNGNKIRDCVIARLGEGRQDTVLNGQVQKTVICRQLVVSSKEGDGKTKAFSYDHVTQFEYFKTDSRAELICASS